MSDTKQLIEELDKKVVQLLNNIKEQQAVLTNSQKKVDELTRQLAEKESRIAAVEAENKVLKETPVESKADSEETKVRIKQLVSEIDNCISLLKV